MSIKKARDSMAGQSANPFWEQPEIVEQFASRAPDHRLVPLASRYADPAEVTVLDLGCAGGRNTEWLARQGFDVWAVDASEPMVARTRDRLALVLGAEEAGRRVLLSRMEALTDFPDGRFALIVALGVFHNAESWAAWQRSVEEAARVLAPGGLMWVNHFTPEVNLTGRGVTAVPGEPYVFEGLPGGRSVLLDAVHLDEAMALHHLKPDTPSITVHVDFSGGSRTSVNALYRKTD